MPKSVLVPVLVLLTGMLIVAPAAQSLAAAPIQSQHLICGSLVVCAIITGSEYQYVSLVITSADGLLGTINLTPTSPSTSTKFTMELQTITINNATLTPPTPSSSGTVFMDCTYTGVNGEYEMSYNGVLFSWSMSN